MFRIFRRILIGTILLASQQLADAHAASVGDFYRGRTVTLVVATSSGGAYDVLARLVARRLGAHIPGQPRIVVQNMPGGGGIVATNWLYNVAAKDGTVVGALLNINPFEKALGAPGIEYDATKFDYLASSDPETGFLAVWKTSPIKKIQDVLKKEATVGTSGPTSSPAFFARLEIQVVHAKLKLIAGYPGQTEAFLAMQRGEIDGYPSVFYSSLTSIDPALVKNGSLRLLLQFGTHLRPEFPKVPSMMDFVKNADDKLLAESAFALTDVGRPFVLPPGVPADRAAAIEKAVLDTFHDPAFQADTQRAGLQVSHSQDGASVKQIVQRVYSMPESVLARLRKLNSP